MKVKVKWKQLWEAVKPVLLAAIGGGIVSVATGCSSLSQTRGPLRSASPLLRNLPSESQAILQRMRGQTTEIIAVGIPAIAWVSHTSQEADHSGSDTNGVSQANTSDVDVPLNVAL